MSELMYCMVCLTTDVKFSIKDYSFNDIYSALTQIKVNNLNQHLCFECAGLLRKYQRFKLKCIHTDKILSQTVVKPKVTKYHLQTLQDKFNIASNLVISNVITEDIPGSVPSEFNEITNLAGAIVPISEHTGKNIKFEVEDSDDGNDNGMSMLLENDEEKPSLGLEPKLEVFTHNVINADKNTITSINEPHNIEMLIKQDNENVIKKERKGTISGNTFSHKTKKRITKKQINIPKPETVMLNNDDESYHSDSSWTNIFNTLNRTKSGNKELSFNNEEETGTANSMLEVEIECSSDKNDFNIKNSTVEVMVESTAVLNSQTTGKQTKRKCKNPTSKITSNAKRGRPKKAKTQCNEQRKTKRSKRPLNNIIETLKKHGTVEVLTQEEARNAVLAMANYNSHKLPVKCDICCKRFKTNNALENHMNKHSTKRGEYECDYCHFIFPHKRGVKDHILTCHIYKFTCNHDGCSFKCNTSHGGIAHINSHTGKTFKCKFCEIQFTARHSIFAHMYKEHPGEFETEFVCELCGRVFYSAAGFKTHKVQSHFNEKIDHQGPECKECKVHFATEQAWDLHLVLSRNHEVENGCTCCGQKFDSETDLKTHMKQHRDNISLTEKSEHQTYDCEFCKVVFKTEYFLQRHLHFTHGQPKPVAASSRKKRHICEICGDKFHARSLLTFHQYIHTGERPYKCQYCGRGFRNFAAQRDHENTHTRAQIYKCHVCDKEFLRHTTREKHVRQCMGKTFHKCVECGQSFINNSTLKSHVRHKHEKVPYPQRKNPRYGRQKPLKQEENIQTSVVNLL